MRKEVLYKGSMNHGSHSLYGHVRQNKSSRSYEPWFTLRQEFSLGRNKCDHAWREPWFTIDVQYHWGWTSGVIIEKEGF